MWRLLLKVTFSAALITWLVWRTPMPEVGATLLNLDSSSLILALALHLAAWWLSALRLWFLAPEFRLIDVVRMTFIGLYYGTVLPGQIAGDVMKAYRLSRMQSASGQAVAVTLIDRIVSMLALFLLGTAVVPWVDRAPSLLVFLFPAASIGIFLSLLVLADPRWQELCTRWLGKIRFTSLSVIACRLVDGLHGALQHPNRLAANFLIALCFHGLCVGIHIVLAHALGIDLPIAVWFLVYPSMAVILLVPISVAGVGLREGGYVGLLALFGIGAAQALSLSFVFFAYVLLGALLGWIVELLDEKRSLPCRDSRS